MEEPPRNIEEFLKSQNWDYWPRDVIFEDNDTWEYTLNKIKEDCSFASIYTHLQENVPRIYDAQLIMESRLEECSALLENHAAKIFEWHSIILGSQGKLEKYKAFLRKYHKKKMIMLSDDMETKKNIEGCKFSGFKKHALTQLPRKLDARRIFVFTLKAQNFDEKVIKMWRTYFLSEASIALLHDCFWWWFLHKFKPDQENQDLLFDRISESYTRLFMSIPLSRKDAFLQVYPDCLAQAIYATFKEAFPESSDLFSDVFKEDLGNNIFLWLSGLKPRKGFWTHWKLKELPATTLHGTKRAPLISVQERIARSQERISNSIDFNMKILKSPAAHTMSISREESRLPKLTTKSHYSSSGPEFNRVLFNFGGQSPLILYYLKLHQLSGIPKTARQIKVKFTEISQEPGHGFVQWLEINYFQHHSDFRFKQRGFSLEQKALHSLGVLQPITPPAPTYCDIIKESMRQFSRNQKDFRTGKFKIDEEIKFLRKRQERIDKELNRLQAKATKKPYEVEAEFEKFLHKLRSEAQVKREFLASPSSASTTEDHL